MKKNLTKIIESRSIQTLEKFLLESNINETDKNGNNLLHLAVDIQDMNMVEFLISKGIDYNCVNNNGLTALQITSMHDDLNILKALLEVSKDTNLNLLHLSSASNMYNNVKYLLSIGYEVNKLDNYNSMPIHWAAQNGNLEIIKLLCKYGAALDVVDDEGQSPLYIASGENHITTVKFLINQNVNIELNSGTPPLIIACAYSNYEIVKELLIAGANINCRDEDGRTPLFYAKLREDECLVNILIDRDANTNIVDNYGISILDLDKLEIRKKLYQELYE
jgi:ankyrin repeat protein